MAAENHRQESAALRGDIYVGSWLREQVNHEGTDISLRCTVITSLYENANTNEEKKFEQNKDYFT